MKTKRLPSFVAKGLTAGSSTSSKNRCASFRFSALRQLRALSLAAASGHNAATAQLLKSFDAAVLIALAHVSKARPLEAP